MAKNEHSDFPPSNLSRFIICNGSWREEQSRPKKPAGKAAERGTLLHEYVVRAMSKGKAIVRELRDTEDRYQVLACVNYLDDLFATFKGMYAVEYERRVTLDDYGLPQVWGTSDVIIYDHVNHVLHVVDWKFGSSEMHYSYYNPQGMAYAAGAMSLYPKAHKVHFHMVQPPLEHMDSSDYDRKEIEDYVELTIKKAVVGCLSERPEYNPTKKGCQYCVANIDCEANRRFNLKLAKKLFDEANTPALITKLPEDELRYILDTESRLNLFIKNVKAHAEDLLRRGKEVPGYKLVNGRINRSYFDIHETEKWMVQNTEYSSTDCYEVKFKSPAAMEKMEGISKSNPEYAKLVLEKPGKPLLVKESDKRPALLPIAKTLDVFEKYSEEDYEAQMAADLKGKKVKKAPAKHIVAKKPRKKK